MDVFMRGMGGFKVEVEGVVKGEEEGEIVIKVRFCN